MLGFGWVGRFVTEEDVSCESASCFWCDKICNVRVNPQVHVTCMIPYGGIGVPPTVVQEVFGSTHSLFCGCSLIGGNGIESCSHGRVDSAGVEEEATCCFFYPTDILKR